MTDKHFINTSEDVSSLVTDALEALVYQHPDLALNKKEKFIYRCSQQPSNGVALLSGGGAGHEPAHAAFVGNGMLTGAISGNVFASPSVKQILGAIRQVTGPAGAILIVKNYTGDIFHFHQAAEKARSTYGLEVDVVVVGDDTAVGRKKSGKVGRRGLAGTVLVHKILGAMAAAPAITRNELLEMAKNITSGLVTIGASLDHVHLPGQPVETVHLLDQNEIELGMGIHNEPGVKRWNPQPTLDELLEQMIANLTDMKDEDRAYVDFQAAESIVLLVNNLGSVSVLELGAITSRAVKILDSHGIKLARVLSGTFMTSLNGPGFSLTLLAATDPMLQLLDASTDAIGWPVPVLTSEAVSASSERILFSSDDVERKPNLASLGGLQIDPQLFNSVINRVCQAGIDSEPEITHADTIVGDGDCGTTLKRGCHAVQQHFKNNTSASLAQNLLALTELIEDTMDGTSGAIYSLFFNGLASSVRDLSKDEDVSLGLGLWASAARAALTSVQKATPARSGDRTLMDALEPFVGALEQGVNEALNAATKGKERTKGTVPAFGRAVYVNEAGWDQVPDPGAMSIVALATGLKDAMA